MRLTLSKKGDPRGRHIVLVCSPAEKYDVRDLAVHSVLAGKFRPVMEEEGEKVYFRFHERFLNRLYLTFPMVELSPGITRKLSRAEEIRLNDMPTPTCKWPGFTGKLYNYQKVGAAAIYDFEYARSIGMESTIDFLLDEMGLGKTYEVLAAIRKMKAFPALIAVPNNVKYTWAEVLDTYFPDIEYVVLDAKEQNPIERQLLIGKRAQVTIVNIEAIRAKPLHAASKRSEVLAYEFANPALFVENFDGQTKWFLDELSENRYSYRYVVIDEHHRVKTPTAQVSQGFFQLRSEDWLVMSGTPILNRPEEWWVVLHKLYPAKFPSYGGFVKSIQQKTKTGLVVGYDPDEMAKLRDFLSKRSLRRRKDQVLKDLPKVVIAPRYIELTPESRALYNEIANEMKLRMESGEIKNIRGALPQIIRLKQACFSPELYGGSRVSPKMEELKTIVSELVEAGEKAIIFSQWSRATRIIERELSEYNPAYVTGEITSLRERQRQINKFRTDPDCKVYIGTVGANREGINLGNATYVIFTDADWTPASMDQAIGRSAAGGLRGVGFAKGLKVHVIDLIAADSIEMWIQRVLSQKRGIISRAVDRDGGVQVEKITLEDVMRHLHG